MTHKNDPLCCFVGKLQTLRISDTQAADISRTFRLVSDVVEKTSTRRQVIPCVVEEKITTRRREGVGVEKNLESRRTFNKNSCDLLTAITQTEILVARCIFLIKSESVSD